jgi:galactose mutarotase-like enzyme
VATTLTAAEEPGVPIAFGWHPYFRARRSAASELRLPRLCHLQLDSCGLPTGRSDEQPATALPLHGRAFDDAFGGVAEGASLTLRTDDGLVEVRHEHGYPCAQIFAPIDAEVVSLEPMTAPVDALRSGEGLRLAPPGTPFTAGFTVRVAGPPPEPGL